MRPEVDELMERLKAIDPIRPMRLRGAVDTPEARAMLERILEREPSPPWGRVSIPERARQPRPAPPLPPRTSRPMLVTALLTTLAVLVATLVLTLHRPPTASAVAIVEGAITEMATLPPLQATIGYERTTTPGLESEGSGLYRFAYENRSRWRADVLDREGDPDGPGNFVAELDIGFQVGPLAPGSFILSDGDEVAVYLADRKHFYSRPFQPELDLKGSPLGQLAWEESFQGSPDDAVPTPVEGEPISVTWKSRCEDSEVFPDASVAGRRARHVRCADWTLWIDTDTGLILKVETSFYRLEIKEIQYSPTFEAGTFRIQPPEGACVRGSGTSATEDDQPRSCLVVGNPAPPWSGQLLGGGRFDSRSLIGKPSVLYFWAAWCDPCIGRRLDDFQAAYRERGQQLNFVSVALTSADEAGVFVDQTGYDFPVVIDEESLITDWILGLSGIPTLVLVDADGRVAAVYPGPLPRDLSELLDALSAGEPLPTGNSATSSGG